MVMRARDDIVQLNQLFTDYILDLDAFDNESCTLCLQTSPPPSVRHKNT